MSSAEEADAIGRAVVLDQADDELGESADATPAADDTESGTSEQRLLRQFLKVAQTLEGKDDVKLTTLVTVVRDLLADGFQPIVFCRFIDTAEYVGEQLDKVLRNATVSVVTGTLPPDERIARIDQLEDVDGDRVLVATDCLAEGVNLQDQFQAVVHYDLAWNPTRHEQREGRVDRFGQTAEKVRAVTIFGSDNQIDGLVLDVLLRKHVAIRKATGVSVPVPDNNQAVVEALMEGLLLRGPQEIQETLDFGLDVKAAELNRQWESAAERERQSQTKYAQHAIHPEEVAQELTIIRAGIGTHASVRAFVESALRSFNATIKNTAHGFTSMLNTLPAGLADALPPDRPDPLHFKIDYPVARHEAVLHRTDPSVSAIAGYVLEAALDPALPEQVRIARRCAVVRTSAVTIRTTLLLVRYRFHLALPTRGGERTAVAEDAALMAFEGPSSNPHWVDNETVQRLLDAQPSGNVPHAQGEGFIRRVLDNLADITPHLDEHGDNLADQIIQSHRRVREAAGEIRRGLSAKAERPADLLGVYIFLPEAGA